MTETQVRKRRKKEIGVEFAIVLGCLKDCRRRELPGLRMACVVPGRRMLWEGHGLSPQHYDVWSFSIEASKARGSRVALKFVNVRPVQMDLTRGAAYDLATEMNRNRSGYVSLGSYPYYRKRLTRDEALWILKQVKYKDGEWVRLG